MKAMVYKDPGQRCLSNVEKPLMRKPTDAVVKILKTTISGTDLNILQGDLPEVAAGRILGHENIGIIEKTGESVRHCKKEDRVIISCVTAYGTCRYCKRARPAHCEDGGWILGHLINGTQAEYVRIPHANNSLYLLPDNVDEEAALMLSDILPTGFKIGVLNSKVKPRDTVALVGAVPVGMAAILTAQFFSPAKIITIDTDKQRLVMAKRFSATDIINPQRQDVVAQITALTGGDSVDMALECVGLGVTFKICQDIVAKGGHIANVGVHSKPVDLYLEILWIKNIMLTTGLVNTSSTPMLLKALNHIQVNPNKLVTHYFTLAELDRAYEVFAHAAQKKAMKVVIAAH